MNILLTIAFKLFLFSCFTEVLTVADRIGCRDEAGNLVDWYYLYKLPNAVVSEDGLERHITGLEYLFITPSSPMQWTMSKKFVNETDSMPGQTLSLIYKKNQDNLVMIYNDEPTNGATDGTRGHTKGVVVANDISGFWLVHSVPKYPPALDEGGYNYPKTGTHYGQSFLCISMIGDQVDKVGKQLKFNEPHFYSSQVPDYLKRIYPNLVDALKMRTVDKAPFYNLETIQSRAGTKFLSFAKSGKFNKELYEDLVAPHYASGNYFVETWRHGPGNIKSDCKKPFQVFNVKGIKFSDAKMKFLTTSDHSKWLVNSDHNLICIGDINRQEHQKVRGGGTVCQQSEMSAVYGELVLEIEDCTNSTLTDFEYTNEIPSF